MISPTKSLFHNIMSSTPVQTFKYLHRPSEAQSPSNCQECRNSRLNLHSSSSEQEPSSQSQSQSISIHVNADTLKSQSSNFQQLLNEIQLLKTQNRELSHKNKDLMKQLVPVTNSQKQLKRQLKLKQRQIQKLRNQISINSYGMSVASHLESAVASSNHIVYEEKNYKIRSKSGRKGKNKQSASCSIEQSFHFNDLNIKKKQWEVQRANFQTKIQELQQKIQVYESQLNWTINLAYKLINMGEKLSYLFKEKVIGHKSSLKVQAKQAWRYIKHVLGCLLLLE